MTKNKVRMRNVFIAFIVLLLIVGSVCTGFCIVPSKAASLSYSEKVNKLLEEINPYNSKDASEIEVKSNDSGFVYAIDEPTQTCTILGITTDGPLFGEEITKLVIPEEIDGCKVISISDHNYIRGSAYAFHNGDSDIDENTVIDWDQVYEDLEYSRRNYDYANFSCMINVEEIVLPDTIVEINNLGDMYNLKKINIPNECVYIGWQCFERCVNLADVNFPDSLKVISYWAFGNCVDLGVNQKLVLNDVFVDGGVFFKTGYKEAEINIGENFAYFADISSSDNETVIISNEGNSFGCMRNLENLELNAGNCPVSVSGFINCENLKNVQLKGNIFSLGYDCFEGCSSLEYIDLPDTIVSIGGSAFANCTSLKEVILPPKCSCIYSNAFDGCLSLEKVVLSEPLCDETKNDYYDERYQCGFFEYAFNNCPNLKYIVGGREYFQSKYSNIYFSDGLNKIINDDENTVFLNTKMLKGRSVFDLSQPIYKGKNLIIDYITNEYILLHPDEAKNDSSIKVNPTVYCFEKLFDALPFDMYEGFSCEGVMRNYKEIYVLADYDSDDYKNIAYWYDSYLREIGSDENFNFNDVNENNYKYYTDLMEEYLVNMYKEKCGVDLHYIRCITYDYNNGTLNNNSSHKMYYLDGEDVDLSFSPTKSGKSFLGWSNTLKEPVDEWITGEHIFDITDEIKTELSKNASSEGDFDYEVSIGATANLKQTDTSFILDLTVTTAKNITNYHGDFTFEDFIVITEGETYNCYVTREDGEQISCSITFNENINGFNISLGIEDNYNYYELGYYDDVWLDAYNIDYTIFKTAEGETEQLIGHYYIENIKYTNCYNISLTKDEQTFNYIIDENGNALTHSVDINEILNSCSADKSKTLYAIYNHTITINYLDDKGNKIAKSDVLSIEENSPYYTLPKEIQDYEISILPDNMNGTINNEDVVINYIYTRVSSYVTVNYLTEDGTAIADTETINGFVGDNYSTQAKTIEGYELKNNPENYKGVLTEEPITVNYIYSKVSEQVTDEETTIPNSEPSDPTNPSDTSSPSDITNESNENENRNNSLRSPYTGADMDALYAVIITLVLVAISTAVVLGVYKFFKKYD